MAPAVHVRECDGLCAKPAAHDHGQAQSLSMSLTYVSSSVPDRLRFGAIVLIAVHICRQVKHRDAQAAYMSSWKDWLAVSPALLAVCLINEPSVQCPCCCVSAGHCSIDIVCIKNWCTSCCWAAMPLMRFSLQPQLALLQQLAFVPRPEVCSAQASC